MLFTPLLALATYASVGPAGLSASTSTSTPPSITPSSTSTSGASPPSSTVAYASDDPNGSLLNLYRNGAPEPERGTAGVSILGPQNIPLEQESPDCMAPPPTDSGSIARYVTYNDGRVEHVSDRWRYSRNALASDGRMGLRHGCKPFPIFGSTHSVVIIWPTCTQETCGTSQGESRTPSKASTIAPKDVLDDGTFSEDSTFLLTDWMAHRVDEANPVSPAATIPLPYTFAASKASATNTTGGTVKVIDSPRRTFNISQTIAVAEITVVPGGIREFHWHPTQPEWIFFLGNAGATVFASANARTFDYQAGDIGYVPPTFGHYVEIIGNTTLKYLEIFNSNIYEDISLNQ
ncbi:Oxalate decarboxylase OxdC [Bacillus subtilis subsp, subtilis str. 168] [Rhizoctonia solani]|uniref:Oxalate decarboxylase OxdC [Bacillus subtilis subsp, subtilis str. 168] n=1 Tax=Rhizoctonia solani TaxID=456999 RepID=A0A0K6GG60_9AGAM|nr:Oxalate decarboxylase OxdC [Bacillus subtilis subsp, subtilis str. 168] [Rhizoctonia solani]